MACEADFEPGLEGFSDTGSDSDNIDLPAPELPEGIRKEVVRPSEGAGLRRPQEGDEVSIHYCMRRRSGKALEDSRERSEPVRFRLGAGQVMVGWEFGVATMRRGELARFTLTRAFVHSLRDSGEDLPEDVLHFEVELLEWVTCVDIFGDGTVLKRVLQRAEDHRRPSEGQECLLKYRLVSADEADLRRESEALEYVISAQSRPASTSTFLPCPRVLDAALLSMKRGERVSLAMTPETAFGGICNAPPCIRDAKAVVCEVALAELVAVLDVSYEADGTVMKRSLRARDFWAKCENGGTCTLLVSSVSSATDAGRRSLVEARTLQFELGAGAVCDALECAALAMRSSEVATVTCSCPEMCEEPLLGIAGQPGLVFHLQVLDYTGPAAPASRGDEERIAALVARKDVAADLVKKGRYRLAAHHFAKVHEELGYVDDYKNMRGGEARRARVRAIKKACMLNRAHCALKTGDFRAAVLACGYVLEEEESCNVKALYRRAQAHLGLQDCGLALRDARAALELEPKSSEIRRLLAQIRAQQSRADEGAAPLYAKMCSGLGALPHPLDVD